MKYKDISGQKFGRLIALYKLHNYNKQGSYWLCYCECGNLTEVYLGSLQSGASASCGCLHTEKTKEIFIKHGKTNTRLYKIWKNMRQRCYKKYNKYYKDYGGRGIKLCDEWLNDFMSFYNWSMNNGYDDTLTIDRIDVDGNYEPSNCRWATRKQQARNRRNNLNYTINGETHCLKEWCILLCIDYKKAYRRLYRDKWSIEKTLELEVD